MPEGPRPRWILDEQRSEEITAALERYRSAGQLPPAEWMEELSEIKARLHVSPRVPSAPYVITPPLFTPLAAISLSTP